MAETAIIHDLSQRLNGPLRGRMAADRPVYLHSAPGRIDVLGGLAAEAGGSIAQMTLPRRAAVAVQLRDDALLVIHSEQIAPPIGESDFQIALDVFFCDGKLVPPEELSPHLAGPKSWAAPLVALWYLTEAARVASQAGGSAALAPLGANIVIHSEIPMGAGQASSTAMVIAAFLALLEARGLNIPPSDFRMLVCRAETLFHPGARSPSNAVPGSSGGIDTLSCLHALDGPPAHLLRYTSQPHELIGQFPLPMEVRVVAMNTGVRVAGAADALTALRLAGAMALRIIETIYRDLGQNHTPLHGYLANISPSLYRRYFRSLLPRRMHGADFIRTYGALAGQMTAIEPERLYRVRAAADHLISDHEHAENFLQAMEELSDPALGRLLSDAERQRTLRRAGRLLLASHHSYRLRVELSCREADWLVESLMEAGPERGIFGARITASGGGGTVVALINRGPVAREALQQAIATYGQLTGLRLDIAEAGAVGSAGAWPESPP